MYIYDVHILYFRLFFVNILMSIAFEVYCFLCQSVNLSSKQCFVLRRYWKTPLCFPTQDLPSQAKTSWVERHRLQEEVREDAAKGGKVDIVCVARLIKQWVQPV